MDYSPRLSKISTKFRRHITMNSIYNYKNAMEKEKTPMIIPPWKQNVIVNQQIQGHANTLPTIINHNKIWSITTFNNNNEEIQIILWKKINDGGNHNS